MSLDLLQVVLAAPAPVTQEPNPLYTVLMFGGLFVFMYFLIIRPQRKRAKEHKNLTESLTKGDEVVMNSGLLGKISLLDDAYITIQAANNVELKFQRASVHAVLPKGTIKKI
jgi:preprotein translocase subunit YajC